MAAVVAGLIGHDGERRLQRVRQVAHVRAGALDNVLIGLEERVALLRQVERSQVLIQPTVPRAPAPEGRAGRR